MTKTPRLTGKELIKILERQGFSILRIKGSHHFLQHNDGRATVIPVHTKEIIGPGLLTKILRDCEIKKEDFLKLI
jgi:predicted RNA binding protein YcfA (HicA-like mRNA interferase family)